MRNKERKNETKTCSEESKRGVNEKWVLVDYRGKKWSRQGIKKVVKLERKEEHDPHESLEIQVLRGRR